MTKKMLTRALACLALLTLISSSLLAQDSRARYPQQAVAAHNSSSVVNPIEKVPSNCHKIAGNFGPSGDLYDSSAGYFVSGINNAITAQKQDIAIAFTPKADSTIVQAKLPLQYYGSGYNGATVAIYSDASGLPGTALSGATRDPKELPELWKRLLHSRRCLVQKRSTREGRDTVLARRNHRQEEHGLH